MPSGMLQLTGAYPAPLEESYPSAASPFFFLASVGGDSERVNAAEESARLAAEAEAEAAEAEHAAAVQRAAAEAEAEAARLAEEAAVAQAAAEAEAAATAAREEKERQRMVQEEAAARRAADCKAEEEAEAAASKQAAAEEVARAQAAKAEAAAAMIAAAQAQPESAFAAVAAPAVNMAAFFKSAGAQRSLRRFLPVWHVRLCFLGAESVLTLVLAVSSTHVRAAAMAAAWQLSSFQAGVLALVTVTVALVMQVGATHTPPGVFKRIINIECCDRPLVRANLHFCPPFGPSLTTPFFLPLSHLDSSCCPPRHRLPQPRPSAAPQLCPWLVRPTVCTRLTSRATSLRRGRSTTRTTVSTASATTAARAGRWQRRRR